MVRRGSTRRTVPRRRAQPPGDAVSRNVERFRGARISGPKIVVPLSSRLESHKEEEEEDTVSAPYNTPGERNCVKSLRLCRHGTCLQKLRPPPRVLQGALSTGVPRCKEKAQPPGPP